MFFLNPALLLLAIYFGSMAVRVCRLYKTGLLLFEAFSSGKYNATRGGMVEKGGQGDIEIGLYAF